jgi:hypothetical protein
VKETMLPNSPAIPLPIPLPGAPVKLCQLIDIHEINDIESALFGCRRRFSLLSGTMPLESAIRPACNPKGAWAGPFEPRKPGVS